MSEKSLSLRLWQIQNRNERRFEQNQGCLGGEETDKQVVGRKDGKRPGYRVKMVHEQGPTKCGYSCGNRKVPRSGYKRFTETII